MKDYAKKNYIKPKQRKKILLFLLISILLIAAFSVYYFCIFKKHAIKKNIPQVHAKTMTLPPATVPKQLLSRKNQRATQSTMPDFDFSFYKMLPSMSVSTPTIKNPALKTNASMSKQYFLQVASSKNKRRTNLLKKQLIEYGFPALETSTVRNNKRWYHIFLGPYTYLNQAKGDQYRLYKDLHMNGILSVINNNQKNDFNINQ